MDIQIKDVVKTYSGIRALDKISLQLGEGVFGLLGPNGAGKTTLMKILTTLIPLTSGHIIINNIDIMRQPGLVRQILGYMPQEFGFYKNLNAYELLDYIGTMKNVPYKNRKGQIEQLLEVVNLTAVAKRRIEGYSGGMKQRLGIAQALLGNPSLLVIDEPTAGLDPEERIRFRNLLSRLSDERTILLSTHIVADIEASCVGVAVLNKGRLIFKGTTDELIKHAKGKIWQLEISLNEWNSIEGQYRIISSRSKGKQIQVRLISSENPMIGGVAAEPTLEDGYATLLAEQTLLEGNEYE